MPGNTHGRRFDGALPVSGAVQLPVTDRRLYDIYDILDDVRGEATPEEMRRALDEIGEVVAKLHH